MKRLLLVFIVGLAIFSASSAQTLPVFVSGKIEFTIKNMGVAVNGTMTGASMQFKQPSADPAMWELEGTVSPVTISTGIDLRDQHLKRTDYFDMAHYPVTSLRSTGIVTKGKNNYEGTFNLTIKGITKSVIIPFTIRKTSKSMDVEGIFTINRLDYGLGEESTVLSDHVTIRVFARFKL